MSTDKTPALRYKHLPPQYKPSSDKDFLEHVAASVDHLSREYDLKSRLTDETITALQNQIVELQNRIIKLEIYAENRTSIGPIRSY